MKSSIKVVLAVCLVLSAAFPVYAQTISRLGATSFSDFRPGPLLVYPMGGQVDLSGQSALVFKWQRDAADTLHYIFKLYKGYNMYESGLILKEEIGSSGISFTVKADVFEDGQVYTWSLVQVNITGSKSDKSYSSFTIKK